MPGFVRRAAPRVRLVTGSVLLAPLLMGYRHGWVSPATLRTAVVRAAFSGMPVARLQGIGEAFARDTLPGLLRADAMAQLQCHRDAGDTVVVVSAGLGVYLAPWCAAHGVALLCSQLEVRDGCLTGRYLGAHCAGAEKARQVREHYDLTRFQRIHAWGDTPEDVELLRLAQQRIYRGRDISGQPLPSR